MTISSSSFRRRRATIGALMFQLLATAAAAAGVSMSMPGCPDICGGIRVPFPFGIGHGCFREGFRLTCDERHRPPKLFLGDGDVEVLSISLSDGTVRIVNSVLQSDVLDFIGSWSPVGGGGGPFLVSSARNWFVAFGCNIAARLLPHDVLDRLPRGYEDIAFTCAATCMVGLGQQYLLAIGESCSGIGRCRASISWDLSSYGIQVMHVDKGRSGDFAPRTAVFIVDRDWFSRNEREMLPNSNYSDPTYSLPKAVPTVLEWSLNLISDNDMFVLSAGPNSSDWRCLSPNSHSYYVGENYDRRRCNCSKGYQGNPYIANGCQDIDECQQPDVYPCQDHETCVNMPGSYRCSSKKRISSLPGLITIIAISAGFGLLFSLLGVAKLTNKLKQRRARRLRQKFFKKNHGLLLQQLVSSNKDIAERMKIFNLQELEQATNKFDQNRILGGGGHGTVYKGILSDQRVVAIKKSNIIVQREIGQFINEVVILSQTNHRNVVKLFGCCLETEVPLLVYEFISNGTLSYHLHGQNENPLSWKDRLRIALETARAIAYLHSAASISVFHRDIKSANILLTDTLTTKVSDFGASRSISIDETGILTAIQGTYGYLDPEYYYTSRLTEKSDVYSFGVILAELLTRVTPVFTSQSSESTSLASYFVSMIRDNRLPDILDSQIVEEGGATDAEVVAMLAESCLKLRGEERPTMRQVETTLQDIQSLKVHPNSNITRVTHKALKDQSSNGSKDGEGTRQYSLEKEFIHSSEIPR